MNQVILKQKIFNLQTELELIKQVLEKEPNFDIDEKNWLKIKPELKKTRKKTYQGRYGKG